MLFTQFYTTEISYSILYTRTSVCPPSSVLQFYFFLIFFRFLKNKWLFKICNFFQFFLNLFATLQFLVFFDFLLIFMNWFTSLLFKVIKATTEHQKWRETSKTRIEKHLFGPWAKGWIPHLCIPKILDIFNWISNIIYI